VVAAAAATPVAIAIAIVAPSPTAVAAGRATRATTGWAAGTAEAATTARSAAVSARPCAEAARTRTRTAAAARPPPITAGTTPIAAAGWAARSTRTWPTERARPTRLALTCLINAKHPPVEILTVELLHGLLRRLGGGHLHEGEPAGPTGFPVHDDR